MVEQRFTTGTLVPRTGLYAVFHLAHQLPREVILIDGEHFPRCSRCACPVVFVLRKGTDIESRPPDCAVHVHELPAEETCTLEDVVLALRVFRDSRSAVLEDFLSRRSLWERTLQHARALRHTSQRLRQRRHQLVQERESCYSHALQLRQR